MSVLALIALVVAAGAGVGMLAGLIGIDGGIVIVPAMYYGLLSAGASADQAAHVAVATSLAAILPAALASSFGHWHAGNTDIAFLRAWGPGIAIGVVAADLVAPHLGSSVLTGTFGLFTLMAVRFAAPRRLHALFIQAPNGDFRRVAGLGIGRASGFAGTGAGTLSGWHSRTSTLVALTLGAMMSMPAAGLAETSDEPAQFAVLGVGLTPCTSLIRALGKTAQFTEVDRQAMLSWAQGYLSSYNSVSEGIYDVTRGNDANALENWLFEFCRKNPRASLMNAVDELLTKSAEPPLLLKHTTR